VRHVTASPQHQVVWWVRDMPPCQDTAISGGGGAGGSMLTSLRSSTSYQAACLVERDTWGEGSETAATRQGGVDLAGVMTTPGQGDQRASAQMVNQPQRCCLRQRHERMRGSQPGG